VTSVAALPHIDIVLRALRITRERLDARAKIAIDAPLAKHLVAQLAAMVPFEEDFYRRTYPDLAEARDRGDIADLHRHFVETGFMEGRFGCDPGVDEAFYLALYPDVQQAISAGGVGSATEHFLRSGAAEGRAPNAGAAPEVIRWMAVLRPDS
jgi:hypothetical protein